MHIAHVAALLLACALTPAAAMRYQGTCDASAAVALDATHFALGEDETDVLAIYRLGQPEAVAHLDLTDYLANRSRKGKAKEADIEAAARIGNRIYWIGSHGRNGKGRVAAARQRLFATDILPAGSDGVPRLQPLAAPPYTRLLEAIAQRPELQVLSDATRHAPENPGGFNIEGLAATDDGTLLIGLRNPRPQGRALLLPLRNPAAVVEHGALPDLGTPIALDLGGRGIRDIVRDGSDYLLVGGPFDDGESPLAGAPFQLYRWSGRRDAAPVRIPADFGTLRPEAVFVQGTPPVLQLLSDDGGIETDGVPCKKLPAARRGFRAITLPR